MKIFCKWFAIPLLIAVIASVSEGFLTLGILVTYTILGLLCGFFSIWLSGKIKNRVNKE